MCTYQEQIKTTMFLPTKEDDPGTESTKRAFLTKKNPLLLVRKKLASSESMVSDDINLQRTSFCP